MDTRRQQKRLGPAPIASFEKSFDDAASSTSAAQQQPQQHIATASSSTNHANPVELADTLQRNGGEMEPQESKAAVATAIKSTTTTTNNSSRDPPQQQQHQQTPGISVSAAVAAAGSSKPQHDGNTATTTKRPPPLKAATASAVTTLVSSAEAQVVTFKGATTLTTPSTPRIELSRASSSSHHDEDSRESSPENVFEQVGTGTLQETIGLGFREEGTLELRSSTEELYFMDPEQKKEEQEKMQQQQQQQQTQAKRSSPHIFKFDEHQSYLQQHQRKDSASSEVAALLCISGRTSRISSVGSQGSAVSRLSAISGISRSPSPHRMLLETSFCGPKQLEDLADTSGDQANATALPTAELLEQVLLARKQDPTQAVLAEGIKVQSSPKRKPSSLANGDAKLTAKITAQNRPSAGGVGGAGATAKTTTTLKMGAQRRSTKSPAHMVVGKMPGGTEYIRINLKPDHMYEDKGIAPNERVVEAPNSLAPVYAVKSQKKPASLSLGRQQVMDETRLTPTASPKPARHSSTLLTKDGIATAGSRSPSPATSIVSRKSSFSSLFRLGGGKDSPDSPRERSRSRSKSKERQTPQSQNVTPSKQKSVLAIFKPGKRGSSAGTTDPKSASKSSSPIDGHHDQQAAAHQRSKTSTPLITATGSRPNSRLRYYDEPIEGVIHIPLHTPPEDKETRKLLQGIQQLNAEPKPIAAATITASQLAAAAAALKPVGSRKDSAGSVAIGVAAASVFVPPPAPPRPQQIEKLQRIENLDAIHTLSQDDEQKETRTWSLEVNRHSSQDSQETLVGSSEGSYASAIRLSDIRAARSNLTHVREVSRENGMSTATAAAAAEIHRLPSVESTMSMCEPPRIVQTVATVTAHATDEDAVAKERRRLLFATRLGSGSQEQIFSTQFSISKTESLSSQLSENVPETIMESTTPPPEHLQRQITVIRREEEDEDESAEKLDNKTQLKRHDSVGIGAVVATSVSTSEDEKPAAAAAVVKMRRSKHSHEELSRHTSRAASDEDADGATAGGGSIRHSRYLENFDVRKKYHENVPRKPKRQSISEASTTQLEDQVATTAGATTATRHEQRKPTLPQPPPPSSAPSPSPPPLASSARASRTPTPTSSHKPPPVAPAPRSQSQSPVDRSGSSSRQTPTKPPRTSTPTRRRGSSSSSHDTATTPPLPVRPAPPVPQTPSPPASVIISTPPPIKHASRKHQQQPQTQADRQSVHSTDEPLESSESERDSAGGGGDSSAATTIDPKHRHLPHRVGLVEDLESTQLVSQESFDDELPYIPTTLPEERAQGVALIPMRERANMELKTCPVDRPRSTTPLNPSHLEEFGVPAAAATPQESAVAPAKSSTVTPFEFGSGSAPVRGEKLRISLPRKDSSKDTKTQSSKSPRRTSNASGKSWFEFAEEGLRANLERKDSNKQLLPPPTPPPPPTASAQTEVPPPSTAAVTTSRSKTKATGTATTSSSKAITTSVQTTQVAHATVAPPTHTSTQRKLSGHWIDFENIPEKRKPAKRITTLPRENTSGRQQQPMTAATHHQQHQQHYGNGQKQPTQPQPQPDVTSSTGLTTVESAAKGNSTSAATSDGNLHYNYVKPEDCQCECHEMERGGEGGSSGGVTGDDGGCIGVGGGTCSATTLGNANNKSITSVDLLQQGEDMLPLLDPDTQDGIEPSDSSREYSCYTDDEMDVPMRHSGSSRSKSSSSKLDEFPRRDVAPSPRTKKFPDNRM